MKNSLFHSFLSCPWPHAMVAKSVAIVSAVFMAIVIASIAFANPALAEPPNASESDNGPQAGPVTPSDSIPLPSSEAIMQNEFLRNALSRSHAGLQVIRGPQGEMSVDLQGRFQSVTTARINPDGEVETTCIESHDSLEHFLAAHPDSNESDYRDVDFGQADAGGVTNED